MKTEAQKSAQHIIEHIGHSVDQLRREIAIELAVYGRLVQEACAQIADGNCGRDCEGTARAIREMKLP